MEASPLPRVPIKALEPPNRDKSSFHIALDYQSREDEAVNGTVTDIKYKSSFSRFPFVVLLDGIVSNSSTLLHDSTLLKCAA